jgi:hypothetical protein
VVLVEKDYSDNCLKKPDNNSAVTEVYRILVRIEYFNTIIKLSTTIVELLLPRSNTTAYFLYCPTATYLT